MNERTLTASLLAGVALASLLAGAPAQAQQAASTDIGQISVEETAATAAGAGYIVQEDSPKERSTVTKAAIDELPGSANIYQLLSRSPGVNAQSTDATGLFGGALSVHGFDSSEIGVTVAGVPVNDSGNYAVFPQELIDAENLQEIDITQGAPDLDQPQGGAVGGAISLVIREPTDKFGIHYVQSLGQLNFFKTFLRVDTGKIADTDVKAFLSYSHAATDRFSGGYGGASRDHVDFGAVWESPQGSKFSAGSYYNSAVNYSYISPTLAQYQQYGRNIAFEPEFIPFPAAVNGKAQNYTTVLANIPSVNGAAFGGYNPANYQGFRVNPFDNEIAQFTADLKILDNLHAVIEPYYWRGFGNGGGTSSVSEATGITPAAGTIGASYPAGIDLNGDGDKLDKVLYYRPSETSTDRPGVNSKLTYQPIDWDTVQIGLNFDHSRHHQTQAFSQIDPNTGSVDVYAGNSALWLTRPDGSYLEGRDQLTFNDTTIIFFKDNFKALNDKLTLSAGVKRQEVARQGNNTLPAAIATGNNNIIHPYVDYVNYLPDVEIGYRFVPEMQVFASLSKSARAPSNFTLYESFPTTIGDQAPETSWELNLGYRYQDENVLASVIARANNFQNRQLQILLPDGSGDLTDINAGTVHGRGFDVEVGTAKPLYGFSLYSSASFDQQVQQSDLLIGNPNSPTGFATLPTRGEIYPNSPKWLFKTVIEYAPDVLQGGFINVTPLYTSSRYTTLVDDQKMKGYEDVDFTVGYRVPDGSLSFAHNITVLASVLNLFDRNYLASSYAASSGTLYSKALSYNGVAFTSPSSPTYIIGAPRFFSVKVTADF